MATVSKCWRFTPHNGSGPFLELLPEDIIYDWQALWHILQRHPKFGERGGRCELVPRYWVLTMVLFDGARQVAIEPQPGESKELVIARARREHNGAAVLFAALVEQEAATC